MAEVELYAPIKEFLEAQGYVVKGEIGACDIMALRDDEGPLVVELKETLNFTLILQAVDRLKICDTVYVAFRVGKGHSASWRSRKRQVTSLLRRLGIGLLTVSARDVVVPVLDPAPYRPRDDAGVLKLSAVRERTGVERAGPILRDNHYGWFDRVRTGHYDLTPKGREDLVQWFDALRALAPRD